MLTVTIYFNNGIDTTHRDLVDFHIEELTYVQYKLIFVYSRFPDKSEELIIDKDKLKEIQIFKD